MKTWFITGASRGFGALIAAEALAAGDRVVATARDPQTVVKQLGKHENLLAAQLDVTDETQARAVVEETLARFGRIDVLVNNAGYGIIGAVEEASADEVEGVFRTNVFGLLAVSRAVLPVMRKQRSGHVINLSSVGGYASGAGFGVYCATKFAVEGLSEAMHAELAPLGIHVTTVEPGYFRTEFLESNSARPQKRILDDYAATSGAVRERAKAISLKQPGDPLKLAKVIVRLAAEKTPPLRLPLGTDTVAAIEDKNRFVAQELDAWRSVAISTNHDDVG